MKRKILLTVFMIMLTSIVLIGCNEKKEAKSKEPEMTQEEKDIKDIEEVVKKMFESFVTLNFKESEKYVNISSFEEFVDADLGYMTGDQFMNSWFDTLGYESLSTEIVDDTTAKVYIKLTVRDMSELLLQQKQITDDAIQQYINTMTYYDETSFMDFIGTKQAEAFRQCMSSDEYSTIVLSVTLTAEKTEEEWKIAMDDDFINALMGDFTNAVENVMGIDVVEE